MQVYLRLTQSLSPRGLVRPLRPVGLTHHTVLPPTDAGIHLRPQAVGLPAQKGRRSLTCGFKETANSESAHTGHPSESAACAGCRGATPTSHLPARRLVAAPLRPSVQHSPMDLRFRIFNRIFQRPGGLEGAREV